MRDPTSPERFLPGAFFRPGVTAMHPCMSKTSSRVEVSYFPGRVFPASLEQYICHRFP